MSILINGNLKKYKILHNGEKLKKGYHNGDVQIWSAGNKVTYITDVGVTPIEKEIDYEAECIPQDQPSKTGWNFVGWRKDTTASSNVETSVIMGDNPITLYAVYSQKITLTYNGNNATSGTMQPDEKYRYFNASGEYKDPKFTLKANDFTKTGYRFTGWDLGAVNTEIELSANKTATAQWFETSPIVYQAKPNNPGSEEGTMNVTVNNTNYVSLSKNPVASWIYYDTGHEYDTGTITINYGVYKRAVIEFYCVPSNGHNDERYGNINVGGSNVYDSDSGAKTISYSTTATNIPIEAHAHNYYDGSFFAIFAYITKITLFESES